MKAVRKWKEMSGNERERGRAYNVRNMKKQV